jgi:hypothetical protein
VREVYQSICQLFELFLLAVFRSFSDVALADIVGETPTTGAATQPQPPPPPEGVSRELRSEPRPAVDALLLVLLHRNWFMTAAVCRMESSRTPGSTQGACLPARCQRSAARIRSLGSGECSACQTRPALCPAGASSRRRAAAAARGAEPDRQPQPGALQGHHTATAAAAVIRCNQLYPSGAR